MKKQNEEITIKEILDLFIPKIWIIVLVSVIAALLVGGYSKFFKKDTYTSYVSFIVRADTSTIPTSGGYDGVQALVADYIHLLGSDKFCEDVAVAMSSTYGDVTASQVKAAVKMQPYGETNFIYAYVTSTSPEFAKSCADAIKLEANKFVAGKFDYKVSMEPVDDPKLPTTIESKNVTRNAAIGFIGGAVISVIVIFLLSRFDVVVRSREALESRFDIPVLGVIPRLESDITTSSEEKVQLNKYAGQKIAVPQQPNVVDGRVVFEEKNKKGRSE